jgi:nitrate/nitrite transporter NarK
MLKNTIKQSFKELITNRYLTVLTIITLILTVLFLAYIVLSVRPSELQLVTHYTAYGMTHLYRDQWFYLFTFGGFALLVAFFHIALSIKIYITKGHPLAIMFAWMGIGILIFAWVTAFSIINVWSPL